MRPGERDIPPETGRLVLEVTSVECLACGLKIFAKWFTPSRALLYFSETRWVLPDMPARPDSPARRHPVRRWNSEPGVRPPDRPERPRKLPGPMIVRQLPCAR